MALFPKRLSTEDHYKMAGEYWTMLAVANEMYDKALVTYGASHRLSRTLEKIHWSIVVLEMQLSALYFIDCGQESGPSPYGYGQGAKGIVG